MKRAYLALSLIIGGFLLSPHSAEASSNAQIRVLHASPDAPVVDVLVNNQVAIEDLSFGKVTDYVGLPAGSYNIKVRPANSSGPDVITTDLTLKAGKDYTVAAINNLSSIKASVYVDNNRLLSDARSKLRVIHLSPGAPAVDIALKNGRVLIHNLSYADASRYLRLKPGTYDLEVRVAGTNNIVLNLPGVKLESGKINQVYAVGLVNGSPEFGVRVSTNESIHPMKNHSEKIEKMHSKWENNKNDFWNKHTL